jgi:hypothetical protein
MKSIPPIRTKIAFVLSALLMPSSLALASSDDHHATDDHGADEKHIVGIFRGATRDAHNDVDETGGIEYEYKFTRQFGIGAVWEKSPDAHDEEGVSVYLASLYWHPHAGWRLGLGAGEEKVHGSHGHTENLVRASIAYDFHVGGFGIAPTFSVDLVDSESIEVLGVTVSQHPVLPLRLSDFQRDLPDVVSRAWKLCRYAELVFGWTPGAELFNLSQSV